MCALLLDCTVTCVHTCVRCGQHLDKAAYCCREVTHARRRLQLLPLLLLQATP